MKSISTIALMVGCLLCFSGCDNGGLGGGAYQATSVIVLPPDLTVDSEQSDTEETAATPTASGGSGPGQFKGRVVLTGSAPELAPLIAQGADVKDAEVCAAVTVPDERLVMGAGNGVANVFIYLQKVPKGTPKPEVTDTPVIFDQKNCRFLPHCLVVPVGQTVKVLSDDSIGHNTHTNPKRSTGVSQAVEGGDRVGKLEFAYKAAEREPCRVTCDFHSWMIAWHLPLDHPYVALTDADGNFEINDLPAGNHVFTVWHEAAKGKFVNRKLKIKVAAGQITTQEIEYAASQLEL